MASWTIVCELQFWKSLAQGGLQGGLQQFAVTVATITFLAFLLKLCLSRQAPRLHLPPGPKPWPTVGNLLQLGPIPHETVAELTRQYRPIVFLKLGSRPALITSSPTIIHDILKSQYLSFSSRPQTICGKYLTYDLHDFIMAPHGKHWRSMRRICVTHLLSPSRIGSFASTRKEEAEILVEGVKEEAKGGRVEVELRGLIEKFAMNVGTIMILGKKWFGTKGADWEESQKVVELLMGSFQFFGVLNVGDFVPWLAWMDLQGYQQEKKKVRELCRLQWVVIDCELVM